MYLHTCCNKPDSIFESGYEEKIVNCSMELPGDRDTNQVRADKTKNVNVVNKPGDSSTHDQYAASSIN